jgi:beta-phosphoglucomutase-like phosphatase (HAD superfamily)
LTAPVLKALLFDVDGTLAETERDGHRVAFNRAFESLGVPWRWSEADYGELLTVAGGRERLLHDMRRQSAAPADGPERHALAERLHRLKNEYYTGIARSGGLPLREGVAELLADCARAGLRLGITTTTSRGNVAALLEGDLGTHWRAGFAAVVCAEEAPAKKPDPEVYRLALDTLGLTAREAVAIEDSPAGIEAAQRAGVPVILTRSYYFPDSLGSGVLAAGASLARADGWQPSADADATRVSLDQIRRWHAQGLPAQ